MVVENAGVLERGNRLFDEQEFIDLCRREQYAVLIDIGHAWANGWSLKRVVNALADQIVAYHLHNNDGVHDSHQRIHEGTLDFDGFLKTGKAGDAGCRVGHGVCDGCFWKCAGD